MSDFEIPKTHRAVIVQAHTTVRTEERPIPTIGENEILVKVSAIAVNPTDWKRTLLSIAIQNTLDARTHRCQAYR